MACSWCSVCWSFEMSSRDLHAEVGWDASQSFASPVTQKAAARCRWLGSPGSQATSFCCNCSCSPRSAPRELSLPHTSWSSSADQKDFPQPCVSRCPGCLSTPWETTNMQRSSSSRAAQLGLLGIAGYWITWIAAYLWNTCGNLTMTLSGCHPKHQSALIQQQQRSDLGCEPQADCMSSVVSRVT